MPRCGHATARPTGVCASLRGGLRLQSTASATTRSDSTVTPLNSIEPTSCVLPAAFQACRRSLMRSGLPTSADLVHQARRAPPRRPRRAGRRGRRPGSSPRPPRSPSLGDSRCRSSWSARPCRRCRARARASGHRGRPPGRRPWRRARTARRRSRPGCWPACPLAMPSCTRLGHHARCCSGLHEDRQHAVGHLAGHLEPDRRDRGGVDRHVGVAVQDALQRLAEAGRAGAR